VNTGLANLYVGRGQLAEALARLNHAAAQPGAAQLALAVHALSAYCLAGEAPPSSVYRRVAEAPATDDFYTANTIAWLTEAIEGGECPVLDRVRIADALHRALGTEQGPGARGNNWLLHTHAARLLASAGRQRDALEHLDLASRLEPERLEAGLLALRYRLELGELEQARRNLADLKRRDSGRVASHSRLLAEYERRLEQTEKEPQPAQ
jgi:predicted Zn-dependent protease